MKAHEVRGLPADEIKTMLTDAESALMDLRFQHRLGQLDNKLQLGEKRREIALLKTLLREEARKEELKAAKTILTELSSKYGVEDARDVIQGDHISRDRSRLRQAVKKLSVHPRRREFAAEMLSLKKILLG
jgi:large subunit ribosomal protein L29